MSLIADIVFLALLVCAGAYGIFSLPFQYPPQVAVALSQSYVAGFSNRVALVVIVAMIGILCLRGFVFREARKKDVTPSIFAWGGRHVRMPRMLLTLMICVYSLLACGLYYCVPYLDQFGEAIYAIPRLELSLRYGLRPFSEIQWNYGPLFFYIPLAGIWFSHLFGGSTDLGFLIGLLVLLFLGLLVLFYIVDRLPIKLWYRNLLFVLIALIGCDIGFAVQSSLLRALTPYLMLFLFHRDQSERGLPGDSRSLIRFLALCVGCNVLVFSTAFEMGMIYSISQCVYCAYSSLVSSRLRALGIPATLLTFLIWTWLFPGCFEMTDRFASGVGNIPIYPSIFALTYLFCIFWLVPKLTVSAIVCRHERNAPAALACATLIVLHMPAALNRADPAHIFCQGVGVFVLTYAALSRHSPRLFSAFSTLFLLIFGIVYRVIGVAGYADHLAPVSATLSGQRMMSTHSDSSLAGPLGLVDYGSVATPFGIDRATKEYLWNSGRYFPEYHPDFISVVSSADVNRKFNDLARASVILVPEGVLRYKHVTDEVLHSQWEATKAQRDEAENKNLGIVFLMPVNFKSKRMAYEPAVSFARLIATNYSPIANASGWVIMVRSDGNK